MVLKSLLPFLGKDLAMDLGTANSLVYTTKNGIVLNEPSVVALDTRTHKVAAVGREAKEYLGRTPKYIHAVRPMKDGVIADFDVTKTMISFFIKKVIKGFNVVKPRIVICVPTGVTHVEKRAVIESADQSGARETQLIEEPMAAAIGADLPIHEPRGNMVVDIGGGTTEVAVISMSSIANAESIRVAGDEMDECIQRHVYNKHQLMIGENMAEKVKMTIGSAAPLESPLSMTVSGKNTVTGNPTSIKLHDDEVRECLREPVNAIVATVRNALEKTPPELSADIGDNGILLTGGGSLLKGLDRLLRQETRLDIHIDEDPLTTVVRGTGRTLKDRKRYASAYIN